MGDNRNIPLAGGPGGAPNGVGGRDERAEAGTDAGCGWDGGTVTGVSCE